MNVDGTLKAMAYGLYPAIHMDPIEKKPLNHFIPGSSVLSIGSVGCNLTCRMCQNWSLSRNGVDRVRCETITPGSLVRMARSMGGPCVAFTYNEPSINFEYIMDASPLLSDAGIGVVLVTNGHLERGPWREMTGRIDAANIDVKGFTDRFYTEVAGGRLDTVLENVKATFEAGVHTELTYLVVPSYNDDPEEIKRFSEWVVGEVSPDVPVHFTRFHPDHLMTDVPATPIKTLEKARAIAISSGVRYVYIGNAAGKGYNDTRCPSCGSLLVARLGYEVELLGVSDGRCRRCSAPIYGIWTWPTVR